MDPPENFPPNLQCCFSSPEDTSDRRGCPAKVWKSTGFSGRVIRSYRLEGDSAQVSTPWRGGRPTHPQPWAGLAALGVTGSRR